MVRSGKLGNEEETMLVECRVMLTEAESLVRSSPAVWWNFPKDSQKEI